MAGPKILVVDDEENILRLIRSGLEGHGYDVSTRANGLEALLFIEDVKPHLIIADIMMPRLSGIDLLKALKNKNETKNIPVIFLSAMDEAMMVQKGLDMGAVDYITKPFKVSEVVGKIRHYTNFTA